MPHIFTISPKAILICINYWLAKKLNVFRGHRVSRLTVEVQQLTGCSCSVIGILGMLSLPEAKSHPAFHCILLNISTKTTVVLDSFPPSEPPTLNQQFVHSIKHLFNQIS